MIDGALTQRPAIVAVALLYLLLVSGIGVWAARRTRDERDFFIAGQRVGLWATGIGMMSAAFSGFVFLGGPGLTYRIGLASLWISASVGFTGGLLCWTLGRRLRRIAGQRTIFTIPDLLACRFESRPVTALGALAVAVGSIGYLASQLLALGILLQAVFGIASLPPALALGLLVLVLYSTLGGMVAGVYTDLVQGLLMLVAAVAVFLQALRVGGGWTAMVEAIGRSPQFGHEFLEPFGSVGMPTAFGFFFVFGVGILGQPHMLHRFFMIEDERKLRYLPLMLSTSQMACLLIWLGIGLVVPSLVARGEMVALPRADDATPAFLLSQVPPWLAGLAMSGALAAIMSTADSFINISSAAVVRDLPRAIGRPFVSEFRRGRAASAIVTLLAALLAIGYGDLIALLGTFAFGTFAATLAPVLVVGFCWKRVTPAAAAASIASGLLLNLGLEFLARRMPLPGAAFPSALALSVSFAVLLIVSLATRARPLDGALADIVDGRF